MLSLFRWKIRSRLCSASRNKNNHLCGLFKSQAWDGTCSVGAVVAISVCPTWCRSCLLKCFTQQGQESFTWCSGHTTSHCRGVTLTEKRHELHMGIITLSLLGVFSQFFLYKWFIFHGFSATWLFTFKCDFYMSSFFLHATFLQKLFSCVTFFYLWNICFHTWLISFRMWFFCTGFI